MIASVTNDNAPLVEDETTTDVAVDKSVEVTKFISSAPTTEAAIPSVPVSTVVNPAPVDADLGSFLARPVLIHTLVWTAEQPTLSGHIDPWTLWMNVTSVQRKFENFHFLRGSLHLKIQVNGNPFFMGRLMMSYEPCFGSSVAIGNPYLDRQSHSSLEHVIIDPSINNEGRLVCPFLTPLAWIDLDDTDSQWIGVLWYDQLATLTYASGTLTTDVDVQIYAWMEEAELCYPSAQTIGAYTPQSSKKKPKGKSNRTAGAAKDEYTADQNVGPVSRVANTISEYAGYASMVPVLEPFAIATQIGANALSKIAGMFGYSRPHSIEAPLRTIPNPMGFMPSTDMVDNAIPMHVGVKSELTIDPRVNGDPFEQDNLVVASIGRKWAMIGSTTWDATMAVDTLLYESYVAPQMGTYISGTQRLFTPMGFSSVPFRYWRGSIEVRIQIVASRFHRGRLRFAWTPDGNPVSASETNLNYGRIIDIDQTSQFEFRIPFGRNVGYCINTASAAASNRDAVNGQVYLAVQNPLSNPEVSKTVEILIWVRAGEDMQYCGPTNAAYKHASVLALQSSSERPTVAGDVGLTRETVCEDLWESSDHPLLNTVYVGDPVRSFRPLLKRYELWGNFWDSATSQNGTTDMSPLTGMTRVLGLPFYPPPYGAAESGYGTYNKTAATYDWNGLPNVLMTWLSYVYVGMKGSTRWSVTNPYTNSNAGLNPVIGSNYVARIYGDKSGTPGRPANFPCLTLGYQFATSYDTSALYDLEFSYNDDHIGGVQYFSPTCSAFNTEWPPYNANRFFPTLWSVRPSYPQLPDVHPDGCHMVVWKGSNGDTASNAINYGHVSAISVAAGEDFQYVGWRGVPVMDYVSTTLADDLVLSNLALI
jgi:hypothetical protein